MNPAHFHLMVNHLPLFAVLFGGGVLGYGFLTNQRSIRSLGLMFGVIAGVGGVVAAQSGERAEEIVEELAGTNEAALESHETAGKQAQVVAGVLGLICLLALFIPSERERGRGRAEWTAWILFVVALVMFARAANLGGPIRHTELVDPAPSLR